MAPHAIQEHSIYKTLINKLVQHLFDKKSMLPKLKNCANKSSGYNVSHETHEGEKKSLKSYAAKNNIPKYVLESKYY